MSFLSRLPFLCERIVRELRALLQAAVLDRIPVVARVHFMAVGAFGRARNRYWPIKMLESKQLRLPVNPPMWLVFSEKVPYGFECRRSG